MGGGVEGRVGRGAGRRRGGWAEGWVGGGREGRMGNEL